MLTVELPVAFPLLRGGVKRPEERLARSSLL